MRANSKPGAVANKLLLLLALQVFLSAQEAPMLAKSAPPESPNLESHNKDFLAMLPAQTPMVDGSEFISRMQTAADSYHTYYFEYKMTAFKKGTVVEEGKFWFKKPRLIRLEETGEFKHGCVAILTAKGKVRAHAGGALGLINVDLAPDSHYLRSANGYPMVLSDLSSLAKALRDFLNEGKTSKVTESPVSIPSQSEKVFILDVYQSPSQTIYKRVAVDSKSFLPVEWWDYESGKLVSHSIWKTFKGNIALADSLFEDTARQ